MIEDGSLKVLLVGQGGREHALAWKLAQSPKVSKVIVAPGNGGTSNTLDKVQNVQMSVTNFDALVSYAIENNINLVVPGPEAPLVEGIEGHFRKVGIRCFGPSKAAARMEGSKAFSKDFMKRHGIPTAEYRNFTKYEDAKEYLESIHHKVVIKASGLAAGKGVTLPASKDEALDDLKKMMVDRIFEDAGDEVVIEEYLEGDELSILSLSDGYTLVALPPAQDHKRIYDGDEGPNTGGMGCYAPTRIASPEVLSEVREKILLPTINSMRKEGFPFVGMLFTGLMMTKKGPKVLEYNVRFGDPETQTILPLLSDDTDLAEIMVAACEGWLDAVQVKIEPRFAATVVVVAGGYPGHYVKGDHITLKDVEKGTTIFHAGTDTKDGKLVTAGGRVLAVTSTGESLEKAVSAAYKGIESIAFQEMFFRKDIAHRAFRKAEEPTKDAMTYAGAGVSIDSGNKLVERIKTAVRSTKRTGTDAEIGGFGGVFDLKAAGYDGPAVLFGAIDGVGTKLKIAQAVKKHDTVGIDLVAMNVNDLVVQGAEALFFLDCFSCSKLDVEVAADFVSGVAEGCKQAGCALVGGETAEMPGMYTAGDYDAVGAAVGAVAHGTRILPDTATMVTGDALLGLASSGVHSNGFSLIRRIVEERCAGSLTYESKAPWDESKTVGEALLVPTRIYVKSLLKVSKQGLVKGMAHITGGGLTENIPRMLPDNLTAVVDVRTWELSPLFSWLKKTGNVESSEFARTWNTGIGMVLVVQKEDIPKVTQELQDAGEKVFAIGELKTRQENEPPCILQNLESWSN